MAESTTPPGWYHAQGDPPDTQRWWDGSAWVGGPQPVGAASPTPAATPVPTPPASVPSPPPAAPGGSGGQAGWGAPTGPSVTPGWGAPAIGGGTGPGGRPLAEPGQRIVARLIDFVIEVAFAMVLIAILWSGGGANGFFWLIALAGIAYEVAFTALKGGTPGKIILGLGVVTEDNTYPPGWGPAVLRWLPTAIPYISTVLFIVSLVLLFTDPEHRTVGDRLARTRVVRTK